MPGGAGYLIWFWIRNNLPSQRSHKASLPRAPPAKAGPSALGYSGWFGNASFSRPQAAHMRARGVRKFFPQCLHGGPKWSERCLSSSVTGMLSPSLNLRPSSSSAASLRSSSERDIVPAAASLCASLSALIIRWACSYSLSVRVRTNRRHRQQYTWLMDLPPNI